VIAARALVLAALLGFGAVGCRATGPTAHGAVDGSRAQCPVCRAEGDLACVDVHVRADTPSSCRCGCTYYFCSRECKERFDKQPELYLGR
jgi:hypothetical protein